MRRSRFSEEQIIGILKEYQAGLGAVEICRKYGVSDATFYKWRSKYGGMEVSDAKRLRGLEEENAKLKRLLAARLQSQETPHEPRRAHADGVCKPVQIGPYREQG